MTDALSRRSERRHAPRRCLLGRLVAMMAAVLVPASAAAQHLGNTGFRHVQHPLAPCCGVIPHPARAAWPQSHALLWAPWHFAQLGSYPPRDADALPTCYRYGRCSIEELYAYRWRPELIERRAPSPEPPAPPPDLSDWRVYPAPVAPTPEENIRPEYRGASLPRDEHLRSGSVR